MPDESQTHSSDEQSTEPPKIAEIMSKISALASEIQVPEDSKFQPNIPQTVPSSLPITQNWPGEYNFTILFRCNRDPNPHNPKGVTWTYSKTLDKVYISKDVPLPICFSTNITLPESFKIRAQALFSLPQHAQDLVHRCINHSMNEINEGVAEAQHLIRSFNNGASYEVDPVTKRHSVVVPLHKPQAGDYASTILYRFLCFGSCPGGPNRRPMMLIFTLENENKVLGRRKVDIKICACPGRDRLTEENQRKKEEMEKSQLEDTPMEPKAEGKKYCIYTKDPNCYDFLTRMEMLWDNYHEIKQKAKRIKKDDSEESH